MLNLIELKEIGMLKEHFKRNSERLEDAYKANDLQHDIRRFKWFVGQNQQNIWEAIEAALEYNKDFNQLVKTALVDARELLAAFKAFVPNLDREVADNELVTGWDKVKQAFNKAIVSLEKALESSDDKEFSNYGEPQKMTTDKTVKAVERTLTVEQRGYFMNIIKEYTAVLEDITNSIKARFGGFEISPLRLSSNRDVIRSEWRQYTTKLGPFYEVDVREAPELSGMRVEAKEVADNLEDVLEFISESRGEDWDNSTEGRILKTFVDKLNTFRISVEKASKNTDKIMNVVSDVPMAKTAYRSFEDDGTELGMGGSSSIQPIMKKNNSLQEKLTFMYEVADIAKEAVHLIDKRIKPFVDLRINRPYEAGTLLAAPRRDWYIRESGEFTEQLENLAKYEPENREGKGTEYIVSLIHQMSGLANVMTWLRNHYVENEGVTFQTTNNDDNNQRKFEQFEKQNKEYIDLINKWVKQATKRISNYLNALERDINRHEDILDKQHEVGMDEAHKAVSLDGHVNLVSLAAELEKFFYILEEDIREAAKGYQGKTDYKNGAIIFEKIYNHIYEFDNEMYDVAQALEKEANKNKQTDADPAQSALSAYRDIRTVRARIEDPLEYVELAAATPSIENMKNAHKKISWLAVGINQMADSMKKSAQTRADRLGRYGNSRDSGGF